MAAINASLHREKLDHWIYGAFDRILIDHYSLLGDENQNPEGLKLKNNHPIGCHLFNRRFKRDN